MTGVPPASAGSRAGPLTSVRDPSLPAVQRALDPRTVWPALGAYGAAEASLDAARSGVEILSHKPGQRCTLRYALCVHGFARRRISVIGKLYGKPYLAARITGFVDALAAGAFSHAPRLRLPAALGYLPDLGLALQEDVAGEDLRASVFAGNASSALRLAARWLATLHSAEAIPGLSTKTPEHELRKVDAACDRLAPHFSGADHATLARTREALRKLAVEAPLEPSTMIHRDFYYAHVFPQGEAVTVIDFDSLSIGDPALDVGHFLAHFSTLALRQTGDADAYAADAATFLAEYCEAGLQTVRPRLPFFEAYTFLKLAALEVEQQQGDWGPRHAADLAALAARAVGGSRA